MEGTKVENTAAKVKQKALEHEKAMEQEKLKRV